VSGGAALDTPLFHELATELKVDVYQGYGCSEMSPMISLQKTPSADHAGPLLPSLEVCFSEEDHELLVRGPNRFMGYLGQPALPPQEYYRTGDTGILNHEGCLVITGRKGGTVKLSNGRFVSLDHVQDQLIKSVSGLEQACVWVQGGYLYGVGYGHDVLQSDIDGFRLNIRFKLLQKPFTVPDGTLTIKGQPRRGAIRALYSANF
jgi:long-chain acyl-CoA synthetase